MEKIYNSNLITVKLGSSLQEAKELMQEKRIRHLPVVDNSNRIIGMLSLKDITDILKLQDKPVELFSSFPVHSISLDEPLSSVAYLMLEKKISSVIVVKGDMAVGIITSDDLLFKLASILKDEEQPQVSQLTQTMITVGEFCRKLSNIGI